MKQTFLTFVKNFLKCGLTGWCIEIMFTAGSALRRRDMTLRGNTSLWMFPIYGCAAILAPISRLLRRTPIWFRGVIYMSLIYTTEFFTGQLLKHRALCPWDYGRSRWNVGRVIRLDYAPCWFAAGLLFERILTAAPSAPEPQTAEMPPC